MTCVRARREEEEGQKGDVCVQEERSCENILHWGLGAHVYGWAALASILNNA